MYGFREESEFFHLTLAMGLGDVDFIVSWADYIVGQSSDVPYVFIEIATSGNSSTIDMMSLLQQVPGDGDLSNAAHRALGYLLERFRRFELSLEQVVKALQAYSNWARVTREELSKANNFSEWLYLAQTEQHGTIESVREDVYRFLKQYAIEP